MSNSPMFYGATPNIFKKAKMLRAKMTNEEKMLWEKLKNPTFYANRKWRRQHPIHIYVADFYCHSLKLVIEIDGLDHQYKKVSDQEREEIMNGFGISTIRFFNHQINADFENVLSQIISSMKNLEN